MKQIKTVLGFEFTGYLKRKSYIAISVFVVAVLAIVLSLPRITAMISGGGEKEAEEKSVVIALLDESGGDAGNADFYNQIYVNTDTTFVDVAGSREELEQNVADGGFDSLVILTGALNYTRIAQNISLYDTFPQMFNESMLAFYRLSILNSHGLPEDDINNLLTSQITAELRTTQTGKNQAQNFFYTYILIFLLYFAVIMYGNLISASVATEKTTRAMEILITSARPNSLMFGKVLGTSLAGFLQMALIIAASFVFYNLNASYYKDNLFVAQIFSMPPAMIVYILVFFILGFLIYAFLFASFSSLISRMEDLATMSMPVMLIFVAAFMVVMFSMASGNVDSALMVVCSYIPLTSPMAMFTRIALGNVATWEIILSISLLAVSAIGIGVLAARIYRLGVLLYGTPPKPAQVIKMLKASRGI